HIWDSSGCFWWLENHGDGVDGSGCWFWSRVVVRRLKTRERGEVFHRERGLLVEEKERGSREIWWLLGFTEEDEQRRRGGDCCGGSRQSSDDGYGLTGKERTATRKRGERVWLFPGVAHWSKATRAMGERERELRR
ncbi:hypothetical protein HAX54_046860, partial [Datura stramonium]|nr:hypothetical protein [Datura stramonium]